MKSNKQQVTWLILYRCNSPFIMDGTQLPIWGSAWLKPALFLHVKLLNRILARALLEQNWVTALRILNMFHSMLLARSQPIFPWEVSIATCLEQALF
jgi:hypothetical protein